MEEVIIYSEGFHQSIEELVKILFKKEYFGFKIDCQFYAEKIYDFVDHNIMKPIHRISPLTCKKFGSKFIKYKANHNTIWYIFFEQKGNQYLITHIMNNHSSEFSELI